MCAVSLQLTPQRSYSQVTPALGTAEVVEEGGLRLEGRLVEGTVARLTCASFLCEILKGVLTFLLLKSCEMQKSMTIFSFLYVCLQAQRQLSCKLLP